MSETKYVDFKDAHYVYVVARISKTGGLTGPVKVGISRTPAGRLASLQTGNPHKLEVACAFSTPNRETAKDLERAFHKVMRKHRLEGEWFDIGPLEAAEAMCTNVRAMLDWLGLDEETTHKGLWVSGTIAVEDRCEAERSKRAFEVQETVGSA